MTESNEDNEIIETELKMLRNKLNGIHDTLKISMAFIILLLIFIALMLWFSPSV
jgi:hypothetical protein